MVKPGFKSGNGTALTGTTRYQFNTGGSVCANRASCSYERITRSSICPESSSAQPRWKACRPTSAARNRVTGERVPVKVEGVARNLLKARGLDKAAAREPLAFVTLPDPQPPPDSHNAKIQLI
jgi:hypothetical protein